MKFVEKCPKCGGEVQTKNLRKAIGLGFVDFPVAQFCLNPQCDWYQDFSETKKPEEIKEGVLQIKIPSIKSKTSEIKKPQLHIYEIIQRLYSQMRKRKSTLMLGIVALYILIIIFYLIPHFAQPTDAIKTNTTGTNKNIVNTTHAAAVSTPTPAVNPEKEQKSYSIKIDVAHGIIPAKKIINISDTIVWTSEENQRTRVVLISKDNLFENKIMEYAKRFSYQFNKSGNYTFVLAEYPSLHEYPNATGRVIVD